MGELNDELEKVKLTWGEGAPFMMRGRNSIVIEILLIMAVLILEILN